MKAWTDYPIEAFGDRPGEIAPIREVVVLEYDGDKYCRVRVIDGDCELDGFWIKSGYLYSERGRVDDAPSLDKDALNKLVKRIDR